MSDEVKPALTPEEWEGHGASELGVWLGEGKVWVHGSDDPNDDAMEVSDRHATAAVCLHGQPFGFTWEMVDSLAWSIDRINNAWGEDAAIVVAELMVARDRIAALLPPGTVAEPPTLRKPMEGLLVTFPLSRGFRARAWLATKLMEIACRIGGADVDYAEIEAKES